MARWYGKTLSPVLTPPCLLTLSLSSLPSPGPMQRLCAFSSGLLCTWLACPHPGPLLGLFSLLFKRPQGGLSAQWLGSQVTSQRPCCPIEWHVESWGEREEDIINHELWKARRAGAGGEDCIEVEDFFSSCSCCCPGWRELSWISAQTHAELKKQQDKFLKNELGEGKELGVGRRSERKPRNDSNSQTKEAPADQPSPAQPVCGSDVGLFST